MKKIIGFIGLGILIIISIVMVIVFTWKHSKDKDESLSGRFTPQITEKTTFNEVNALKGVSLKTPEKTYKSNIEKITVVFQNHTDKEYTFGESYSLERLENNQWYKISQDHQNMKEHGMI